MWNESCDNFDENVILVKKNESNKTQTEKEFLVYLDEEGILKELEQTASHYEKTVNDCFETKSFLPPFRFQLKLDIIKLQEISEQLHQLFTKEPDVGMELAEKIIFCGVQLLLPSICLKRSDLQIVPLVFNLPITCEIFELLRYPSLGLECVQGILMNKTTVTKYLRSFICICESEYCPKNTWQRYPENFRKICPTCLSLMKENVLSADTGEEIICQMISMQAYQNPGRFQVLNVRVKDELCNKIYFYVGEEYVVTGKLTENFFEAVNIVAKQPDPSMNFTSNFLPKSITDLYYKVRSSHNPWSFVYALASPLGSDLIPISSFLHLKMGLLLGLCTQKTDIPPTPLVAIGSDSNSTQYLFHVAGKMAERYVKRSIAHSYLGGAAKPGYQEDIIWLEAGQLILAANGVCNLGDWSKFKKEQANYICQTIESGQIVMNKGDLGKTNLIDFVRLKCSVWIYWCHISTALNHQLQLKTLINVFGIPFLAEEKNEFEIKKICRRNLQMGNGSTRTTSNIIQVDDLKEFIKIINKKELGISDAASQLIRNYFVISRREKPHCLPIGAIKTITSLAEAHARLALRDEVLSEDVIAIIYLYEESMSELFGRSLDSYPKLDWDQEEPIYLFMGKQLQQFELWLEQYLHNKKFLESNY